MGSPDAAIYKKCGESDLEEKGIQIMNEQMRENLLRGSAAYPFALYHMPNTERQVAAVLHWQDDVEILSVTEGGINLTVDGNVIIVSAGDIVCINPGQLHSFHGNAADTQLDIFIFP